MIWINIIRIVILNNIQRILVVNRTPWVNANANDTVTFKPYNSQSTSEETFYYSVSENSRSKLQEYAMKYMGFHLRN